MYAVLIDVDKRKMKICMFMAHLFQHFQHFQHVLVLVLALSFNLHDPSSHPGF